MQLWPATPSMDSGHIGVQYCSTIHSNISDIQLYSSKKSIQFFMDRMEPVVFFFWKLSILLLRKSETTELLPIVTSFHGEWRRLTRIIYQIKQLFDPSTTFKDRRKHFLFTKILEVERLEFKFSTRMYLLLAYFKWASPLSTKICRG